MTLALAQRQHITFPETVTGQSAWRDFFVKHGFETKRVEKGFNSLDRITPHNSKEQGMTYTKDNIVFTPKPTINNFIDHTGQTFGRLTVIGYAGEPCKPFWWCECSCGKIKKIAPGNLRAGVQSCGCLKDEMTAARSRTHGESNHTGNTPEYRVYLDAKNRCTNPNNKRYASYGERGIEFRFASYADFLDAMGRRPTSKHSLEREDNDGHYARGNCKWATNKEQARNKRNSRRLTLNGKTQCVVEWAEEVGMKAITLYERLNHGWCDMCAVFLPLRQSCSHK